MAFTIQAFVADPTLATGNLRLPAYVINAGSSILGRLPLFVVPGFVQPLMIVASGTATQSPYSSNVLQRITASGTAEQTPGGASTFSVLPWTAVSTAFSGILPTRELIVASSTGVTGQVSIPGAAIPLLYVIASGTINSAFDSRAVLPAITAKSTGLNGSVGTSSVTRSALTASGLGGALAIGTSTVTLPLWQASGLAYVGTGATFSAVVLQTQIQGLTTYSNFAFNSLARFNGVNLGASDSGLFKLIGNDDAGTQIQAAARFAITDFDSAYRKRVERAYIGYRCASDLILRVRTNEVNIRDYRIPGNTATGMHGTHVKLGRGVEARYWQFEIRNQSGADFSIDMIEVKPIKLERRVGGSDA